MSITTVSSLSDREGLETSRPLLDAMACAVYTTDRNGIITYFNPAAVELWGRKPEVGVSLWCGSLRMRRLDGTLLAHEDCPMAVCVKTGASVGDQEILVERPDGGRKHVRISPRPIRDGKGQMIGAINTIDDITEQRQSERERDTSNQLTQSILRNSKDCIKLLDLDGTLRSINPCGCSSLELASQDDALGMNYFDFWQPADREAALAAAESAQNTGSGRFSADFVSRFGTLTTWDEMLSLINDAEGKPTGYLVISRDITAGLREAWEKTRQLARQEALSQIGALALTEGSFQAFMDRTIALVAEVLEVPLAKILPFADQADHLWLAAGVGWNEGLVGKATVGVELASQAGYTLSVEGPVVVPDLQTETRFDGPPLLHQHGVRGGMSVTIPGTGSRPFGVIGVHDTQLRDFDEGQIAFLVTVANLIASCHRQHQSAKRQTLLVREIAHRSGNMLQFVTSIFNQTVRKSESLTDAKTKFEQRLAQMSKSNLLISNDGWTKSSLRDLVAQTLEPFQGRVDISGRDVILPADLCFDLGLVLHELATNSSKYGAFAGDEGQVSLSWVIETKDAKQHFVLTWSDGKRQPAAPVPSTGFGTKLIHQLIEAKWRGKVTTEIDPTFYCRLSLPLPAG
ncbi:PAS domain S-box [Hoeflea sp. IMCC20628]|uniref:PAS domain-containing sensor histidine kinase n=1 Tax=Hoeflea sp. IMCC20628 TaxID=1620421 RepID=UPI00063AEB29|nr:PAS domain-containing protein [Hoeflea sp. IMCC20628]AKH99990.1 PAS domain S-box [Hoeflea sp. IMCC20628]